MAFGQMRSISGSVMDRDRPLSGVTVRQKGTELIAVTDKEGRFQIEVNGSDAVLEFEHPDYEQVSERIGQENRIKVLLSKAINKIEEVLINAGYYTVKDKERTGSIAKVTAKDIENQPVTNVLSAIQGRASGVNIVQSSGVPGSNFDVQIRGQNSLRTLSNSGINGSAPLYVVDGVPLGSDTSTLSTASLLPTKSINPLNTINPDDIASIEILKDADATAIYGSRGANGVVLITTKKGRSGSPRLVVNTSYGFSQSLSNLNMMNTEQYLKVRRKAFANDGISTYPTTAYDINGIWDPKRYTDWKKTLIGHTADYTDTRFSLSGGSEQLTFLVSGSNNVQHTVFGKDFKYVDNNISSSLAYKSADGKLVLNLSNRYSNQQNNIPQSDITTQAYFLSPNAPALYHQNGSLNWENNTFSNPIAAYEATYSYNNRQFLNSFNVGYEPVKNLKLKLNGGYNYTVFQELLLKPNTMYNPSIALGQSSANSSASKRNQNKNSFIVEPQVEWLFAKNNHKVDVLVGGSLQKDSNSQGSISGLGFESNAFITNIGAATTKNIQDQITVDYKYAAVFSRFNYHYKDRYFLNVTARRDGSSRFGPDKRYANFGAVGAAWIFSEEAWLKNQHYLSYGKLRASFGTSGSDNIGDYQYLDSYTVSSLAYNNITGLSPMRLFNPNYSWEKTNKLEAALELGFFQNRINFNLSWYRNRSGNQLVGYQLPSITGFTSVVANLDAVVQNQGWEIELSSEPIIGDKFKWSSSFNLSFPSNKLIAFPGIEGSTYSNNYIVGKSLNIVKLYQFEGIDPTTGLYTFTDFNKDGKISSPNDNKAVENIGVRFFGGWSNNLKFKNWNISFLFQFVKQKNRNYNYIMPLPGSMNNLPVELLDVWSSDNPSGQYMPYTSISKPAFTYFRASTATVSDASYIRLKNIQVAYNIPLESRFVNNVKIYFQGQNLLTFTKYFGIDPEFQFIGFAPPVRTYSFGTQFNF
ncbi:SusC/RagA family TonB-linked outer membrane protein [Chryseobacterium sp. POL2]|uniref:SusC/RagA family TonB-linked outer membrane protein n=1 Tax=Chryseobacterium sp. POL2 TaxID=2713414 RepID=UPI00293BEF4D|nr:SusC/RagA family TonB-linked outer membrane protein [Chryseobacterium sp. POL2]